MPNLSAALRRALQTRSAEALAHIAAAWAVEDAPEDGGTGQSELLGEKLLDIIAARFAWENLSPNARSILHQMIVFEVVDGVPREDLQKLTRFSNVEFVVALTELEQSMMLIEARADAKVKMRLETRGQQISQVLTIPKDFREMFIIINREIYGPSGDLSKMKLVEVLETLGQEKLQAMYTLYTINPTHYGLDYFSYAIDTHSLSRSIAGKLVQADALEVVWEKLNITEQRICRWLCQADGMATTFQLRTALDLSRVALGYYLRRLENYGLVFSTFSGQEYKVFIGRSILRVLRKVIGEADQVEEKARAAPAFVELKEAPPVVYEGHGKLLYDLAIIIGAVYQMVLEPTQAGRIPKRLANKIFPLLHSSRPAYYEETDDYLDMVFAIAESLELIRLHASSGQKARYLPGHKLAEWERLETFEQVRLLLALWRNPSHRSWSDVAGANYRPSTSSYSFGYYMDMQAARKGLLKYLAEECRPGRWYTLGSFLNAIKARNPLLLREQSRYAAYGGIRNRKEVLANWDRTDGEIITGMLTSSIHEMGLVSIGFQAVPAVENGLSNPAAFQFTDLAAQVIWSEEESASAEQVRTLIAQPNFELLLLQPDYSTLYQLLPFARVDQVEMVSRLTLTQESVRRGVEAGFGVEQILRTLQARSQKDLPQNVLYTLQDWSRLYKDATVSQVILLEVSSETVADEICASPKFRSLELRRLGPCAITVGGQVSLQVLRSTLEKEGVILHIQGDILNAREFAAASTSGYGRRR